MTLNAPTAAARRRGLPDDLRASAPRASEPSRRLGHLTPASAGGVVSLAELSRRPARRPWRCRARPRAAAAPPTAAPGPARASGPRPRRRPRRSDYPLTSAGWHRPPAAGSPVDGPQPGRPRASPPPPAGSAAISSPRGQGHRVPGPRRAPVGQRQPVTPAPARPGSA
mgnify:CR=1 FL=1